MKTIILAMSPRKSFSASMYFSKLLKFFIGKSEVSILELKTQNQYIALEKQLDLIDNLVFATPVYVDSIPSTVLERLQQIEAYARDNSVSLNVYALANCGFYEGEQCELALETFRLWCKRCGFSFKGGLGIGSGVMVSFIRTLVPLGIAITLAEILIRGIISVFSGSFDLIQTLHFFPYALTIMTGLYLLWSTSLFLSSRQMAARIRSSLDMETAYIHISFCPRFLFVVISSLYWVIASMIWYRGAFWRLHKEPKEQKD